MRNVKKIKLFNFKRFHSFEINFNEHMNLLVGDNESGKSTILLALDIVLRGSRSKVETIGLDKLINNHVVEQFMIEHGGVESLPSMVIEVYLNEQNDPDLNGKNNSDGLVCDGLRLCCSPIDEFLGEIGEILSQENPIFPFEYYSISFSTFSGELYTGNRKFLKHLFVDNSQINNDYAAREYTKTIYNSNVEINEKNFHQNEYRRYKSNFKVSVLSDLNEKLGSYGFDIRTDTKSNLITDLTITEDGVSIENKGKGRQCFIKTEFALQKNNIEQSLDVLLLEEPENHLSHTNMRKLVQRISETENKQIFVATHNSLICTRLDLRKVIMLNSLSENSATLETLPEETAKFFMKAPDNNILEFILSNRVLLVEGDAEYILIDSIFKNTTGQKLEELEVHVISVGGTSFKRYLDIAKILNIRTAVIRDNDGDHETNCIERYLQYQEENIKIFFDENNNNSTFEICFYEVNKEVCDELFEPGRRTLTVQDYMLSNKADSAFELMNKKARELVAPEYIRKAIEWIKE
ncbi:MAG: TOPRIM nucleotidyl transferase/hydrolase domain-containing protein [Cyanobacteria bacterium P01_C01_bin.120]